jgi:threonine synthase
MVRGLMDEFKKTGKFKIKKDRHDFASAEFRAHRCSDEETLETMKSCYERAGILIDPHTAVGLHAALLTAKADPSSPMVVTACAHPAKFPEAVQKATGIDPVMPPRLAAVMKKAEHMIALPNDYAKIAHFVKANSRG